MNKIKLHMKTIVFRKRKDAGNASKRLKCLKDRNLKKR